MSKVKDSLESLLTINWYRNYYQIYTNKVLNSSKWLMYGNNKLSVQIPLTLELLEAAVDLLLK